MSRRREFEDDGRTIADMSGLGGDASDRSGFRTTASERPAAMQERERGHAVEGWQNPPFSWKERLHYMGAALGAALLIALVFLGGLALVIWLVTLYGK